MNSKEYKIPTRTSLTPSGPSIICPLVDQTKHYLDKITKEIDENVNARVLVEGPARSGKTVLAMSLLAKYPKSKMLLMNWYFYDALIDAFKIWAELSRDEIEQLFAMPQVTEKLVASKKKLNEFKTCQLIRGCWMLLCGQ